MVCSWSSNDVEDEREGLEIAWRQHQMMMILLRENKETGRKKDRQEEIWIEEGRQHHVLGCEDEKT